MKPDKQLAAQTTTELVEVVPGSTEVAKPVNPLLVMHSLLRGRYWLAICLAVLGAVVGAPLGYHLMKPEYQSTGTISFDLVVGRGASDAFLAEQMEWMKSSRVRDLAMEHPEWKALGRGLLPHTVASFEENLQVSRGSGLIRVTFTDKDPRAAATAVKAVIQEYKKFFEDLQRTSINRAEEDRRKLQQDLRATERRRHTINREQGWATSLQKECDETRNLMREVDAQLQQTRERLQAIANEPAAPTAEAAAAATQSFDPAFELAVAEKAFLQELHSKSEIENEIRDLQISVGDNHPRMITARARAALIDRDLMRRYRELQQLRVAAAQLQAKPALLSADLGPDQLKENERVLEDNLARMTARINSLVDTITELERLDREETELRARIAAITAKIEELKLEKDGREQISVVSTGDIPLVPAKDRRKALSALGGLGMAAFGVGLVMLLGLLDGRLRHVDAARSRLSQIDRLLGVLPELPEELSGQHESAGAAYCVNHIRAMIQIRQRTTGHKTFAVTSPSPGDGKTSLVVALGMSFASSGSNTLVIDCDFDGGGLSSRLQESANPQQGVVAVLRGRALDSSIIDTGHPMLSLLPLGVAPGSHSGQLSPTALRRVLDKLEDKFDTILIDCGPILGSVEAAVVCAEADSTILLVSRGGNQNAAERAANLLGAAGAEIEGIVFNRALAADVARSAYHSSTSARSQRSTGEVVPNLVLRDPPNDNT